MTKKGIYVGINTYVSVDAEAQVEFIDIERIEHVLCRFRPDYGAEDELLDYLCTKAGVERDNRVAFRVTKSDGTKFAIGYSNGIIIGV